MGLHGRTEGYLGKALSVRAKTEKIRKKSLNWADLESGDARLQAMLAHARRRARKSTCLSALPVSSGAAGAFGS